MGDDDPAPGENPSYHGNKRGNRYVIGFLEELIWNGHIYSHFIVKYNNNDNEVPDKKHTGVQNVSCLDLSGRDMLNMGRIWACQLSGSM